MKGCFRLLIVGATLLLVAVVLVVYLGDGFTSLTTSARLNPDRPTRGSATIPTDRQYNDPVTGCQVVFDIKRGQPDLNLILAGRARDSVVVDLLREQGGRFRALPVAGQLDKRFLDSDELYIHQYYDWNETWPAGNYRLDIRHGRYASELTWRLRDQGDYHIHVYCN